MSSDLAVWIMGTVLLLVLLPAELAVLKLTRRRLDLRFSRRIIRSAVFLAGVGAWAYVSPFQYGRRCWFISFFVVAGLWKLLVDVLIVGVPDRMDS